MNEKEILERLIEGNKRFASGNTLPKDHMAAREATKDGQTPFVTVVSCSDSRVVPEYIFDLNIGEVFTIITAGNIVDTITLGSIEYGVYHLHTPLLIVLGHEKCGAITAACQGGVCPPNIQAIIDKLKLPVHVGEKDIEKTICINTKVVIEEIRERSDIVKQLEKEGKLKLVAMKYYFEDGRVELID
ncbi:MAG: carbonic anhydrase [Candidatus Micrarchaeota archaeon]